MFTRLKSKVTEAVNERVLKPMAGSSALTNQAESYASSNPARSRTNSFSSMASDSTQYLFGNYSSPNRAYNPPSDFESEIENESFNFDSSPTGNNEVKRLNKLLGIYKNKFAQLKDAYAESETEKERIKKILTESQDKVLKRVQDLKNQIEVDRNLRKEQEFQFKMQLTEKENQISSLKSQLTPSASNSTIAEKLIDFDTSPTNQQNQPTAESSEAKETKEKIKKLETLLARCKDIIKTQKEQLNEKESEMSKLKEDLSRKESVEIEKSNCLAKLSKAEIEIKNFNTSIEEIRKNYEQKQQSLVESNQAQLLNIEKLQKRCSDLSFELEEKGSLFQKQFQLFQAEFVQKEDNLLVKLKSLQEDLDTEKEKNKSLRKQENLHSESDIKLADYQKESDLAKKEIEELKSKLIKENELKSALEMKLDEIVKEKAHLKSEFDEVNNKNRLDINELNAKLNDLLNESHTNEIKELNNQFTQLKQEHSSLESKLDEEIKEKARLAELIKDSKSEKKLNKIKEKHSAELDQKQNEFELKIAEQSKIIENLNFKLETLKNENELHLLTIRNLNQSKKNEIEHLENEILSIKAKLTDLEADKKELESQLEVKSTQYQMNIKQIDELNLKLNDLESQSKELLVKLEKISSEKSSLESKLTEYENTIADLRKQIAELNEQTQNESQTESEKQKIQETIMKDLNKQIEQLTAKTKAAQSEMLNIEGQLSAKTIEYQSKIEELSTQIEKNNHEYEAKLTASSLILTNKVSELQATIDDLNNKLEDAKSKFSSENSIKTKLSEDHEKEINNLKELNKNLMQNVKQLRDQLAEKQNELKIETDRSRNQIQSLETDYLSRIELLTSKIDDKTKSKLEEQLNSKTVEYQKAIDDLNKQLEDVKSQLITENLSKSSLNDEFQSKLTALHEKLHEQETKNVELEQKIATLSLEYQNKIDDLNRNLEILSQNEDFETKISTLNIKLKESEEHLSIKCSEYQTVIDGLNKKVEELNDKLENESSLNHTFKLKIQESDETIKLSIDEYQKSIDNLNKQLEEVNTQLTNEKSKQSLLNEDFDSKLKALREQLLDSELKNKNLDEQISSKSIEYQAVIDDLNKKLQNLNDETNVKLQHANTIKSEFETQLQLKTEEYNALEKAFDAKLFELTNQLKTYESQQCQFEIQLNLKTKDLADKNSAYTEQITELNAELEQHKKNYSDLEKHQKNQIESLEKMINSLKEKVNDLNDKSKLADDLDKETNNLKELNKNLMQNVKQLRDQLAEKQTEIGDQTEKYRNEIQKLEADHENRIKLLSTEMSEKIESEKSIANMLITDLKTKHDMTLAELENESKSVKNLKIDLTSAQVKLNENLTDYKSSIEKFKQASNVRYSKLKKKLANCIVVLNLIDKNLIQLTSSNSDAAVFTVFLQSLSANDNKNKANLDDSLPPEDTEFSESLFEEFTHKIRDFIEKNLTLVKKLDNFERLEENVKLVNESLVKSKSESDSFKSKLEQAEATFKLEKEKLSNENQRHLDDLQLKLANLDLKYKQIQLEDNKESHTFKRKLLVVEDEISKLKNENEQLKGQQLAEQEKNEKNLANVKQKADLRVASIKKQYENETSSRVEELNTKNHQLECELKEKIKLIELLKSESEVLEIKLSSIEADFTKRLAAQLDSHNKTLENKDKNYESLIGELETNYKSKLEASNSEMHLLRNKLTELELKYHEKQNIEVLSGKPFRPSAEDNLSQLKKENQNLSKQFDELKMAYDELKDEKAQIFLTLNDLKHQQQQLQQQQSNDPFKLNEHLIAKNQLSTENGTSNDTFLKFIDKKQKQYDEGSHYLNSLKYPPNNPDRSIMTEISDQDSHTSSIQNLSSMCLEPTEIDYLRQIVYSYMMGTDPITMAKVIVAVLKFPEDEKRKIIENEKSKYSTNFTPKWFSSLAQ